MSDRKPDSNSFAAARQLPSSVEGRGSIFSELDRIMQTEINTGGAISPLDHEIRERYLTHLAHLPAVDLQSANRFFSEIAQSQSADDRVWAPMCAEYLLQYDPHSAVEIIEQLRHDSDSMVRQSAEESAERTSEKLKEGRTELASEDAMIVDSWFPDDPGLVRKTDTESVWLEAHPYLYRPTSVRSASRGYRPPPT